MISIADGTAITAGCIPIAASYDTIATIGNATDAARTTDARATA